VPINEAIERAHKDGILTATSLMVGSPAAADAVERARRLPSLKVGLHVVVVRGMALLPHERIPVITDRAGMLPNDLFRAGVLFFFNRSARRQLEGEIRAQFEAFRATGLPLDHVDAHNHLHYHPTVLGIILRVGRDYGVRAIRLPREPFLPAWRAAGDRFAARLMWSIFLWPWLALMRARIRRAGLMANDAMFGMGDSGGMTRDRVLRIIGELPDGLSEIYFHPATTTWDEGDGLTEGYDRQGELAALTSADVIAALRRRNVQCTTFSEVLDG
jgi:hopanoid biosynthesis associated protein HpnK